MDESLDEKILSSEYSTFNPDETRSWNESLNASNDPFPVALNPQYDLQALIMVMRYTYRAKLSCFISVWKCDEGCFL